MGNGLVALIGIVGGAAGDEGKVAAFLKRYALLVDATTLTPMLKETWMHYSDPALEADPKKRQQVLEQDVAKIVGTLATMVAAKVSQPRQTPPKQQGSTAPAPTAEVPTTPTPEQQPAPQPSAPAPEPAIPSPPPDVGPLVPPAAEVTPAVAAPPETANPPAKAPPTEVQAIHPPKFASGKAAANDNVETGPGGAANDNVELPLQDQAKAQKTGTDNADIDVVGGGSKPKLAVIQGGKVDPDVPHAMAGPPTGSGSSTGPTAPAPTAAAPTAAAPTTAAPTTAAPTAAAPTAAAPATTAGPTSASAPTSPTTTPTGPTSVRITFDPIEKRVVTGDLENGRPTGVVGEVFPIDMVNRGSETGDVYPPGLVAGELNPLRGRRGHLLGNLFGGSGRDVVNLAWMHEVVNNSTYKTMFENPVRAALDNGSSVQFSITPLYEPGHAAPYAVEVWARATAPDGTTETVVPAGTTIDAPGLSDVPMPPDPNAGLSIDDPGRGARWKSY